MYVCAYAKRGLGLIAAVMALRKRNMENKKGLAAWQAVVQLLAHTAFKHLHNVGDGWIVGHGFVRVKGGISPVLSGFSAVLARFPPSTAVNLASRGDLVVVFVSISRQGILFGVGIHLYAFDDKLRQRTMGWFYGLDVPLPLRFLRVIRKVPG